MPSTNEYPARDFVPELTACFGVEVEKVEDGLHPPPICVLRGGAVSHFRDTETVRHPYDHKGDGCGERRAEPPVVLMQNLSDSEVAESPTKGNG